MRLIPGRTKVKVELFRGVRITDVIIAAAFGGLLVLVFTSNLSERIYIALGLLLLATGLLARVDSEPNYVYLLHVLRHLGSRRHFARAYTDEELQHTGPRGREDADFEALFSERNGKEADSRRTRRMRRKEERAKYRAENRILRSKKAGKEEKDAVWLARADRSAERKREKAARRAERTDYADMSELVGFTDIADDFIFYGDKYYGAVLEVSSVEFRFFSEYRRTNAIENGLGAVLRGLNPEYAANIVKLDRTVNYDSYRENEYEKLAQLRASYEQGFLSEEEFKARTEVLLDRIAELTELCNDGKVVAPFYYIVLYDGDRNQLRHQLSSVMDTLRASELPVHRLNTRELAIFLKYSNEIDFDENDIDRVEPQDYRLWAMPGTVHIQSKYVLVNRFITHNMRVVRYPTAVGDSWLASVLSIPNTKVVIKCRPMDRARSVRNIDRALQELRGQYMATGVDSKRMELQEHIETLSELLAMLQSANETLLETNIYITAYDLAATRSDTSLEQPEISFRRNLPNLKRTVRRCYQEAEMRLNNMEYDQLKAFIGSQINAYDPMGSAGQGIPSNSLAACYPWIFAHVSDVGGIKLGSSEGIPVFIDFFRRDSERVNSNMVIVGKSGSGKSYAAKSLLTNLAADNAKIFILDPENEYSELAENLHGKFINVGNAQHGRLNPFHIITALEDDETGGGVTGSYAAHLQFLEEFFRQILPDCDKDALEYLNSLIDRMYTNMGITADTDLRTLRPEDYPVFDDLYDAILGEFQGTDNEYIRSMLRTLMNYVAKFSGGGRNANIWNGPSSITTEENFTVFNFQSLLANRNGLIANAQMLLVLKYIDNEIIKNRDYNTKYGLKRKIVVVIDEAHVFIDSKFPVALDFMYQLAKRIRKYNGMQIVITQNIKDFVGSEEIARKSTAIINACQYSFIFSLAPNDMQDLCTLYEKAGGINEMEQEQIISAPRGQAFAVMSPQSRTAFRVEVPEDVVSMFRERQRGSNYYGDDEEGQRAWAEFLGDSREKNRQAAAMRQKRQADAGTQREQTVHREAPVMFEELSEEEFTAAVRTRAGLDRKVPDAESPIPAPQPAMQPVPQPVVYSAPQPVIQPAVQQSGQTEQLLSELLGKFSYDTMMQEIRRSVREELERGDSFPTPGGAPEPLGGDGKTFAPEEIPSSLPLADIFNIPEAEQTEEASPLPDYAGTHSIEDDGDIDIMALIRLESKRTNRNSPIDMMDTFGEEVIELTLEELMRYNQSHT